MMNYFITTWYSSTFMEFVEKHITTESIYTTYFIQSTTGIKTCQRQM